MIKKDQTLYNQDLNTQKKIKFSVINIFVEFLYRSFIVNYFFTIVI